MQLHTSDRRRTPSPSCTSGRQQKYQSSVAHTVQSLTTEAYLVPSHAKVLQPHRKIRFCTEAAKTPKDKLAHATNRHFAAASLWTFTYKHLATYDCSSPYQRLSNTAAHAGRFVPVSIDVDLIGRLRQSHACHRP